MAKKRKGLSSTIETQNKVEQRENILKELKEEKVIVPKKVKKKPVRVSVDFPRDLYVIMKEDTAERGQTLKGFIVSLVRSHYNNKTQ